MKSIFHPNKASLPNYICHSVIWDRALSNSLQILLFLISHVHVIIILLWIQTQLPQFYPNELLSSSVQKIIRILCCKDVYSFDNTNLGTIVFFFALIACYFIGLALMFFFSLLCTRFKNISFKRFVGFAVFIGQAQIAIGFWVINSFLMQYVSVETNDEDEALSGRETLLVFAFVLMILNYLVTLFFAVFSYDPFLSLNILSCHTSGAQILNVFFKFVTAPMLFMSQDYSFRNWFLVVTSVLILAGKLYFLVDRFPYYQYTAMKLALVSSTIDTLIALVNLIVMFIEINGAISLTSVIYTEALLACLAVKLFLECFHRCVLRFIALKKENMTSPKDVMKKLFALLFLFRQTKFNFHEDGYNSFNLLRLSGLLSVHLENPQDILFTPEKPLDEAPNENSNKSLIEQMHELYHQYEEEMIKELLETSTKRWKESKQLKVLYIYFGLKCRIPFQMTMLHLTELKESSGLFRSICINLHDMLQESVDRFFVHNTGKILNLKRYVQQTNISSAFIENIQSSAMLQISLWRSYLKSTVKMNGIWEKSKKLEHAAEKIDNLWKKDVVGEKNFASSLYRVYSSYLSLIRGCPMLAQLVVQRYFMFRQEQLGSVGVKDNTMFMKDDLTDPNVMTICSSIAKIDAGRIISVSSNFSELTGWAGEEIVGESINTLLPHFIARVHDRMLQDHLNVMETQKKSTRLYKTVPSYLKHRNGHVVACEVYISIHPYITEVPTYLVLVRVKHTKFEEILIDSHGIVQGFTHEIMNILTPDLRRILPFSTICLNASDVDAQIEKNAEEIHKRNESLTAVPQKGSLYTRDMATPLLGEGSQKITLFFQPMATEEPKTKRTVLKFRVEINVFFFDHGTYFALHLYRDKNRDKNRYDDVIRVVASHRKQQQLVPYETDDNNDNTSRIDDLLDDIPVEHPAVGQRSPASEKESARFGGEQEPQSFGALDSPSGVSDLLASPHPVKGNNYSAFRRGSQNSGEQTAGFRSVYGSDQVAKFESASERGLMAVSSRSDQILQKAGQERTKQVPVNNVIKIIKLQMDNPETLTKSSKKVSSKLENALNYIPPPSTVNKFYIVEILLILLSSLPLLIFGFQANSELDLVHSSVEVLSEAVTRLVRMSDLYGYARGVSCVQEGIASKDRYIPYGYTESADEMLSSFIPNILTILDTSNKAVSNYVAKLKSPKIEEIYAKTVPIYLPYQDGAVYRYANLFDTVDSILSEGIKMVTLGLPGVNDGLPYNWTNSHWAFIQNNSVNEAMVIGEKAVSIIANDNQSKINTLTAYLYVMIGVVAFVGGCVFILFHMIIRKAIREKAEFVMVFLHFQDHQIKEHIHRVEKFAKTLDPNSVQIKKLENQIAGEEKKGSAKATFLKKKADTKGLNMKLYMLYLASLFLIIGLFLAHPVLAIKVKTGCDGILSKINLATQSNLNFHELGLLFATIYAYVQSDATTYLRNKPIAEEYATIFRKMTMVQDFLIGDLLDTEKGLGKNTELQNTVRSNLCEVITLSDKIVESLCTTLGGGAATRGLIGLNSFTLSALKEVKSAYDNSDKSYMAASAALNLQDLSDLEVLYSLTYQAYVKIDNILQEQLAIDFKDLKGSIQSLGLSFFVIYLFFGILFSLRIRRSLVKDMEDWRKLIRQVPYTVASDSKHFRAYVQKTSGNHLMININN